MAEHQELAGLTLDEVNLLKKYAAKPYAELKRLAGQSNCPVQVRDESVVLGRGQKLLRRVFLVDNRSSAGGWVLNDDSPDCFDCGSKFHVSRRRHHCRKCGSTFCKRCIRHHSNVLICHQCHYARSSFSVSGHPAAGDRQDSLSRLESDIPTPPLQPGSNSHPSDLLSSESDRANLKAQIEEAKELFAVAEMDNNDLRQELLDVHNQLNDERARKLTLRVDLDQVRAKLFLAIDEGSRLQTELDDLKEKIATAERFNADLAERRREAEQSFLLAQERSVLLEAELGTLNASLHAREKVCAHLLEETEQCRKKLHHLTEENIKLRMELEQAMKLQESEGLTHDQLEVDNASVVLKVVHEEGVHIHDRMDDLSSRLKASTVRTAARVSPTSSPGNSAGSSKGKPKLRASVATSTPSRLRTLTPEMAERPQESTDSVPAGDAVRSAPPPLSAQTRSTGNGTKATPATKKGSADTKPKGPRTSLR